ncbi:MAG: capsular biosynthesis protein [Candidatus Accumulibacter sp. UW20]|jgi:capsular polysaccharide export protein
MRLDGFSKSFLFLQGSCSHFFMRLANAVARDGHAVRRVVFNVGDWIYSQNNSRVHFRGRQKNYREFLSVLIDRDGITDLVMHGDSRYLHQEAKRLGIERNLRIHVFEEGYFRPNWITLERGGINGHSPLPSDPDFYLEVGRALPEQGNGEQVSNPTWLLAAHELAYHVPNIANYVLYPGYRTHRPYVSAVELAGWAIRFSTLPLHERRDNDTIDQLLSSRQRFYFFPLQLDSDSQIKIHSDFQDMSEVIEMTLRSFAAHAPVDHLLVIKNHPHDIGMVSFKRVVARLGRELGISKRVVYLESGNLPRLLKHTRGVVTVNSTVGPSALVHLKPVIALGRAVYAIRGLTFQGDLRDFWHHGEPPDKQLFRCFRDTVIYASQINGGLYSSHGIDLGVRNSLTSLYSDRSPLEYLLGVGNTQNCSGS